MNNTTSNLPGRPVYLYERTRPSVGPNSFGQRPRKEI